MPKGMVKHIIKTIFMAVIIMFTLCALTSCADKNNGGNSTEVSSSPQPSTNMAVPSPKPTVNSVTPIPQITPSKDSSSPQSTSAMTEDEAKAIITDIIPKAANFYGNVFNGGSAFQTDTTVSIPGFENYVLVVDDRIKSVADLETWVEEVFTPEVGKRVFSKTI